MLPQALTGLTMIACIATGSDLVGSKTDLV